MFCKKCGSQLDDNALFCSNCGEKCSSDVGATEQKTNVKISIGEKVLRFINIVVMVFAVCFGVINLLLSNIIGGIIILLTTILLIVFVFRKKQISKIKNRIVSITTRKIVVTIIYLLMPVIMFASVGFGSSLMDMDDLTSSSLENPNLIAVSYAEAELKSNLKNPASLQIHSTKISVEFEYEGYHYYSITIDYSAQNGFGGYNRNDDYDVLVKVSKATNTASVITSKEYLDAITNYRTSK